MFTVTVVGLISMTSAFVTLVINHMLRGIHVTDASTRTTLTSTQTTFRKIRRHTGPTNVWENTVSAGSDSFFDAQPTVYIGRHHRDPVDLEATEITDDRSSSGRHSVDNPYRQQVSAELEEIRWANGTRSYRPLWIPVIGAMRIALLTSDTSAYAIVRKPLTPFSQLTRPHVNMSGKIPDSYYAFTATAT